MDNKLVGVYFPSEVYPCLSEFCLWATSQGAVSSQGPSWTGSATSPSIVSYLRGPKVQPVFYAQDTDLIVPTCVLYSEKSIRPSARLLILTNCVRRVEHL